MRQTLIVLTTAVALALPAVALADSSNGNDANAKCKAEQSDPNFAASHGGKTFDQFYGTNKNDQNAFGKCVSQKSAESGKAPDEAKPSKPSASKQCKAERKADPAAFKQKYGTNKKKSNAFGKCVSSKKKAKA